MEIGAQNDIFVPDGSNSKRHLADDDEPEDVKTNILKKPTGHRSSHRHVSRPFRLLEKYFLW